MNEKAERINGWAAMIGVIAAMGSYAVTGQIIPGIWQLTMTSILFTMTSVAFFVLLAASVEKICETY